MSSFCVAVGLNTGVRLPDSQIILIGRHKHLKSLSFDQSLREKLQNVDESMFLAALKQLEPDGGSVPLYLDLAKV